VNKSDNSCADAGTSEHNKHQRGRAEKTLIKLLITGQDDVQSLVLRDRQVVRIQRLQCRNTNTQRLRLQRLDPGVLLRDGARYRNNVNICLSVSSCFLYRVRCPI